MAILRHSIFGLMFKFLSYMITIKLCQPMFSKTMDGWMDGRAILRAAPTVIIKYQAPDQVIVICSWNRT